MTGNLRVTPAESIDKLMKFVGLLSHFFKTTVPSQRRLGQEEQDLMRTQLIVIAILCLSIAGAGHQAGATTDLSELGWIAGHWAGTKDGVEMEESWLAPKGNTMLGLHRDVKNNRTVSFEFLRIEATPDGVTYWASPRGKPATPFRLIDSSGKRVVFENAQHDFPQRIIYWLGSDKLLHAKIEGTLGGKPASEEWAWRRSIPK